MDNLFIYKKKVIYLISRIYTYIKNHQDTSLFILFTFFFLLFSKINYIFFKLVFSKEELLNVLNYY